MANASKKVTPRLRKLSVYLYIPNIIGYARVLLNCYAFAICFSNKWFFSVLYFISFVCDAVDGWCARKFNQVSTFGAVLDMVTDRISTACLLAILSQIYRPGLIFVSLLALDIGSHWLQMYSTFLTGKTSHKDVKDSTSWLFKAYYGNRMFMGYCCVACEVLYLTLFLIVDTQNESLVDVVVSSVQQGSLLSILVVVAVSLFQDSSKNIQISAFHIFKVWFATESGNLEVTYTHHEEHSPEKWFRIAIHCWHSTRLCCDERHERLWRWK